MQQQQIAANANVNPQRQKNQLGKTAGEQDQMVEGRSSPFIMSSDGDDIVMIETLDRYERAFKSELMGSGGSSIAMVEGNMALNNDGSNGEST